MITSIHRHLGNFVVLTLVCAAALPSPVLSNVLIDTFDSYHELFLSGGPPGPKSIFESTAVLEALGGERNVLLERTSSNSGSISMDIDASFTDALSFASSLNTSGRALIVYDGLGGGSAINYLGLGGVDLTENGVNRGLFLGTTSDVGANVTFTIYSDATHSSTLTLFIVPDTNFTFDGYFADFTTFSNTGIDGGADYTNVGAISVLIDGTSNPSTDVGIDYFFATVPEPSGALLILTAGMLFIFRRRN